MKFLVVLFAVFCLASSSTTNEDLKLKFEETFTQLKGNLNDEPAIKDVLAQLNALVKKNSQEKQIADKSVLNWNGPASIEKSPQEAVVETAVVEPVHSSDPSVWFVILIFVVLASVLICSVYAVSKKSSHKKWGSNGKYT